MRLSFDTPNDTFAAVCPKCEGYVLLTLRQAATGVAQCFGNLILLSWSED